MLFVEKLENESSEDVRVYLEALVCATYPRRAAVISRLLPFGPNREWKTLLRVSGQIAFKGRTFCAIEWFALRIYVSLLSLAEGGTMSRDAIFLYRRPRTVEEAAESGSFDAIVMASLLRGGKAERLKAEDVLAACPSSLRLDLPFVQRLGPGR